MAETTSTTSGLSLQSKGTSAVFADSVAVATTGLQADDVIRPVKVAGGTKVHRVVYKVTDMDSGGTPALAAKIGFTPIDGSTAPSGADTAIASAGAFAQSAATTTVEVFPPYVVEKDSFLNIVVTTSAATAAAGTVYAKVEGDAIGVK